MLNRAVELHRAGQLAEAEEICRSILRSQPDDPDTLNLFGLIAAKSGRLDEAEAAFRKALIRAPNEVGIISNLADAMRLSGKYEEALHHYRRIAAVAPGNTSCQLNLAITSLELGLTDQALAACLGGLKLDPGDPDLNGLAADIYIQQKRSSEAAPLLYRATSQAPENYLHWQRLSRLLQITCLAPNPMIREWLTKAVQHPAIRTSGIAASVASSLCMDHYLSRLIKDSADGALGNYPDLREPFERLSSDTLLLTLMTALYIPSSPIERLLTGLRRILLLGLNPSAISPSMLPFCSALAAQSFLTDYAWAVSSDEEAAISRIEARVSEHLDTDDEVPELPGLLTVIGAYRPLHGLKAADRIAHITWPGSISSLIKTQLLEPLEELDLRTQIPRLTRISNQVSLKVRAQYETNPFPHWHNAGITNQPVTFHQLVRAIGGAIPEDPSFSAPDVLIAGCGTGQQSITAARNYDYAEVIAIDLSMTSLAYATRKTRESGITNIRYFHGDIMELSGLGRRFHVIESSGVLHHLDDPVAGWKILAGLLHPNGLMNIGLYSNIARRHAVAAREQIMKEGYKPTPEDMRRYRLYLLDLPKGHPLSGLRVANDLYNLSELRDFLFHVREHRFTIPQIDGMLQALGLHFLGFNIDTRPYLQRFPDDPRAVSLENWHTFEQEYPDTFINMYQFWVQKIQPQ